MTTQIIKDTRPGLPLPSEYAALVAARLPDRRPWPLGRIALVVIGTLTGLGFLYACAHTDLFL